MAEETKKLPTVSGVDEQSFALWKHHPVTRMYLKYLLQYREALHADHLSRWETQRLDPDIESEARGRCSTLNELANLPFNAIVMFYGQQETETEQDGSEADQDDPA